MGCSASFHLFSSFTNLFFIISPSDKNQRPPIHPTNHPSVPPASQRGPPSPVVLSRPPLPVAPRPSPRRARHPFAATSAPVQPELQHSPGPSPQPSPRSKHKFSTQPLALSSPPNCPTPPVTAPPVHSPPSEGSPGPQSLMVTPIQEMSSSPHHPKLSECESLLPPASTQPSPAANSSANMSAPELSSSTHTISSSFLAPHTSLILSTSLTSSAHPPVTWTLSQPPPLPKIFQAGSGKGITRLAD